MLQMCYSAICLADIIIAPSSDEKVTFVRVRQKTSFGGEKGFMILDAEHCNMLPGRDCLRH